MMERISEKLLLNGINIYIVLFLHLFNMANIFIDVNLFSRLLLVSSDGTLKCQTFYVMKFVLFHWIFFIQMVL